MPSLQEKSLVIVSCLVNYNGVVKIHTMTKLVCVLSNFRIAVAITDSSFMFTKFWVKCFVCLAIICKIAIKAVYFVHYTSRLKDKPTLFQSWCIVYIVNCLDCDFAYYGQTDRVLTTRLSECKRAVRDCDSNSKIARHANQFGHTIIVGKAADYNKRLFLEAWHSKRDQNAGNEHTEIPDIYISIA